jgi:hypothetical protein
MLAKFDEKKARESFRKWLHESMDVNCDGRVDVDKFSAFAVRPSKPDLSQCAVTEVLIQQALVKIYFTVNIMQYLILHNTAGGSEY